MPKSTSPDGPGAGLSRRTALGLIAGVGAAAAGCSPMTVDQTPADRPTRRGTAGLDPDIALAATALDQEQAALDLVQATIRRHPRLRGLLADARRAHTAHVRILTDAVPKQARPHASPSPSASASASAGVHVAASPAHALRTVARHENRLALSGKTHAFSAQSGAFARLLAGIAASAAQQATFLSQRAAEAHR
ncbi:MAG: hypothetical protein ACXVEQ_17305 [Nocardioidaceae bacterium]